MTVIDHFLVLLYGFVLSRVKKMKEITYRINNNGLHWTVEGDI